MSRKIDWLPIKIDYLQNGLKYTELASKYKVSIDAVKKRAAREKWANTRSDVEVQVEDKISELVAESIIEPRVRHAKLAETYISIVEESLTERDKLGRRKLKAKSLYEAANVGAIAVKMHREALQIDAEKPPLAPVIILIQNTAGETIDLTKIR